MEPESFVQDEVSRRICGNRPMVEPVVKKGRNPATLSRWFTDENGKLRPLLLEMAFEKYGTQMQGDVFASWMDGNWQNETMENVVLKPNPKPGRPPSKYGIASGTPEYQKEYRKEHREKLNAYFRERQQRIRAESKAFREFKEGQRSAIPPEVAAAADSGASLISSIQAQVSRPKTLEENLDSLTDIDALNAAEARASAERKKKQLEAAEQVDPEFGPYIDY